jgi:hypothetical protein
MKTNPEAGPVSQDLLYSLGLIRKRKDNFPDTVLPEEFDLVSQ